MHKSNGTVPESTKLMVMGWLFRKSHCKSKTGMLRRSATVNRKRWMAGSLTPFQIVALSRVKREDSVGKIWSTGAGNERQTEAINAQEYRCRATKPAQQGEARRREFPQCGEGVEDKERDGGTPSVLQHAGSTTRRSSALKSRHRRSGMKAKRTNCSVRRRRQKKFQSRK